MLTKKKKKKNLNFLVIQLFIYYHTDTLIEFVGVTVLSDNELLRGIHVISVIRLISVAYTMYLLKSEMQSCYSVSVFKVSPTVVVLPYLNNQECNIHFFIIVCVQV